MIKILPTYFAEFRKFLHIFLHARAPVASHQSWESGELEIWRYIFAHPPTSHQSPVLGIWGSGNLEIHICTSTHQSPVLEIWISGDSYVHIPSPVTNHQSWESGELEIWRFIFSHPPTSHQSPVLEIWRSGDSYLHIHSPVTSPGDLEIHIDSHPQTLESKWAVTESCFFVHSTLRKT